MKSGYRKIEFYGLLIQGRLHDAIKYLEGFENKDLEVKKYYRIFNRRIFKHKTDNYLINQILDAYSNYYIDYFWDGESEIDARKSLEENLMRIVGLKRVKDFQECEKEVEKLVQMQGYSFLGNMTGMLYGPYIWKDTEIVIYEVEIPNGVKNLTINMMDGFVSRSWLDFISLGKIGTGGWASRDGELFCVRKYYKNSFDKPSFLVSYLKHEAQHISDYEDFGEMCSIDLEYRAKLTELIYFPNLKLLHSFINEANSEKKENAHTYSAYLIVTNLSKEIFNEEYVSSWTRWKGKGQLVRCYACKLLKEHTEQVDE